MKFLAKNYKCQLNFKLLHKQIILSFFSRNSILLCGARQGISNSCEHFRRTQSDCNNKTIYLTFLLITPNNTSNNGIIGANNLLNFYFLTGSANWTSQGARTIGVRTRLAPVKILMCYIYCVLILLSFHYCCTNKIFSLNCQVLHTTF